MRIVVATDAWHPQINGVVRSQVATIEGLRRLGHDVMVIEQSGFFSIPCPSYPEIRLAIGCGRKVRQSLDAFRPDAIHIATEGPIGLATRKWCRRNRRSFTTAFHTRFPDYVSIRTGIPESWLWAMMRRFHGSAQRTFVATQALAHELNQRGVPSTVVLSKGVDRDLFNPSVTPCPAIRLLPGPIMLYVGRVAVEKNIEAFLRCGHPGSKVVVGDGPALTTLRTAFPDVHFLGARHGTGLAAAYAAADVFVFPSRTDTFGLVNIEALACGCPVAAYPVPGPMDILGPDGTGVHGGAEAVGALDEDLDVAIDRALLGASREAAAAEASHYSWDAYVWRLAASLALDRYPCSAVAQWTGRGEALV